MSQTSNSLTETLHSHVLIPFLSPLLRDTLGKMQQPVVILDILLAVMLVSRRHEVSAMMKTCRLLYEAGVPYLLKETVDLKHEDDIVSFVTFMAAEQSSRLRYDIGLRLSLAESLSPGVAELLTHFLKNGGDAMRFRTLHLDHPEKLLSSSPGLADAFSTISYIDRLHVYEAGPLATSTLQNLRAEVHHVSVRLDGFGSVTHGTPTGTETDLTILLHSLRGSLLSFHGEGFDSRLTHETIFPNVASLSLTGHVPIYVPDYARAFPNVTNLATGTLQMDLISLNEAPRISAWRLENRSAQLSHGTGSWPALKQCRGTVADLWALGLRCEVEKLTATVDMDSAWELGMLGEVLRDLRPKYLEMFGVPATMAASPDFAEFFQQKPYWCLKTVVLKVSFPPGTGDVDGNAITDCIVRIVSALKLDVFVLGIDCYFLQYEYLPDSETGLTLRSETTLTERFLKQLDVDAFADSIQGAAPALRGLQIKIRRLRGSQVLISRRGDLPKEVY
ncbi:hypothetical protein L226DRAFT_617233 [Lentinus tigrinus ALCF2SS1-7]|uniref:F-box domain-containing protein n=1 Tax=Lentinus tigrinus ALCF2SS1-6 TaxID=1328759 RepID=A0A5C2RRC1_9APHY|nr:hypothetical protein L227DRAFT_657801 [Lentinus tigrinus ALCF2SS1-6]RPD68878.1 hypothetical protein L226DRAFT_617233 [Lentinus tigrinus ALCF2SS1-7]